MILTENFLNKVKELFTQSSIKGEHQILSLKDSQLDATLIKADADTLIIKVVNKPNPDKQKLNEFLSKFSESQFGLLTDKFEEITGKPLNVINQCYEQGRYNEVHQLLVLVTQRIIEEFSKLLK